MSDPGDFIDAALRYEGDEWKAEDARHRLGDSLDYTGASVGAVRGTVRSALQKFRALGHDDITALSSELWRAPVFERRLAAVVLLQSRVTLLRASDLTRLEGFARDARVRELLDPLAVDVIGPLVDGLDAAARAHADVVLDRWPGDEPWLRRAAILAPLRAIKAGRADADAHAARVDAILAAATGAVRTGYLDDAADLVRTVLPR